MEDFARSENEAEANKYVDDRFSKNETRSAKREESGDGPCMDAAPLPKLQEQSGGENVLKRVKQIYGNMCPVGDNMTNSQMGAATATARTKDSLPSLPSEQAMPKNNSEASNLTCLRGIATTNEELLMRFITTEFAEQNRKIFLTALTDWVKDSATPEEARRFEISGKFKREAAKCPAKSLRITRDKYIEEQWSQDGRLRVRHLGRIVPEEHKIILKFYDDFSQHRISPKVQAKIANLQIERSPA